jgi:hypothetical protein
MQLQSGGWESPAFATVNSARRQWCEKKERRSNPVAAWIFLV